MDVKMAKIFFEKRWNFRDRVSKAYYDYGRLCSAHPTACLSISILTTIFLSYPALSKVRLPISSPMDTYWGNGSAVEVTNESVPEWLYLPPTVYLQHIIVKGRVEPFDSKNTTPTMAVKGPLSAAFKINKIIDDTELKSVKGLSNLASSCFRAPSNAISVKNLLPKMGACLTLSPSLFWNNEFDEFLKDDRIFHTIFKHPCASTMCARDILFGTPTRMTGIKPSYQTNRYRSIQYSVTILLSNFDPNWRSAVVDHLANQFEIEKSRASDDDTFIHVFYRPRKYFTDYFPLFVSYFLCMLYFYYTVSKFEMVKNKWALAVAAFITVFTSLSSTAGICSYFELTPTLWGAGVYPYLAMVVGLENILCITRSVVYTPPTLEVQSRVSHGLSLEGFSISKYFVLEMTFLFFGYITCVPEIQEFCTFAFIGLVVDFYMQLFFYTPCLTFDLQRLDSEEKRKFAQMLFNTDIKQLKNYPKLRCPAESLLPFLFVKRHRQIFRTFSDAGVEKSESQRYKLLKNHRRTASVEKSSMSLKHETLVSNRLRLLYYWTKTRFFHRLLMAFFSLWVLWLAFIVHKWRLFDILRYTIGSVQNESGKQQYGHYDGFGISHHLLETAPLEWSEWQRNTFRWWPALFSEYNISLSGHYVTFAPPIVLRAAIPPDDISLKIHYAKEREKSDISTKLPTEIASEYEKLTTAGESSANMENPELGSRIYWLERQMTAMLVFSIILPFSIVIAFILYIFWDKWSSYRHTKQAAEIMKKHSKLNVLAKNQIELVPLLFSRHEMPAECIGVYPPSTIISTSLGGRILVWDSSSGELKHTINRAKASIPTKTSSSSAQDDESGRHVRFQVWCLDVRHKMLVMGYSSGFFELYSLSPDIEMIGNFTPDHESTPGITHVKMKGNRIILARLNGTLESYEFSSNFPTAKTSDSIGIVPSKSLLFKQKSSSHSLHTYDLTLPYNIRKLTLIRAHQKPIVELICTNFHVITSSFDSTIKVFDIRSTSMRLLYTLNGHDRPVVSICADEQMNTLFSCCEAGLVLGWDMCDGQLVRTLENESVDDVDGFAFPFSSTNPVTELAQNSEFIVGFNVSAKVLSIWNKLDGELTSRLTVPTSQIGVRRQNTDALVEQFADNYDMLDSEVGKHLLVLNEHLAVSSAVNLIHLWDLDAKTLIRQIRIPKTIDKIYAVSSHSILCCCSSDIYAVSLSPAQFPKAK